MTYHPDHKTMYSIPRRGILDVDVKNGIVAGGPIRKKTLLGTFSFMSLIQGFQSNKGKLFYEKRHDSSRPRRSKRLRAMLFV